MIPGFKNSFLFPLHKNPFLKGSIFVLVLLLSFRAFSQQYFEKGELTIRNYHQKEYKGSAQNFGIVQDKRGVMYFANNGGVLEYDGVSWRLIRLPNNSIVKTLAIDEQGRIFVGAQNELGYLAPDSTGYLTYYSLTEYIPEGHRNFDMVWKAHYTTRGVYFQTSEVLFLWDGKKIKFWKPETSFVSNGAYVVNNKLYLDLVKKGLYIMNGDEIVPVIDGDEFIEKIVADMVSLDKDKILVVTKNHGNFVLTPGGVSYSYPSGSANYRNGNGDKMTAPVFGRETDNFLREKVLQSVIKINDDLFAFGTEGDGILIIHRDGYLVRTITKEAGLQDNIIKAQYIDHHNNFWIALANGIAKIEINTPITYYTDKSGITGTVEAITRHNGLLFIGTQAGIYYLPDNALVLKNKNSGHSKFISVPDISMECWDLLSFKKGKNTALLAGLNDGIFEIRPDKSLSEVMACAPWTLFQSRKDPSRVYIGLDDGISSIYFDNGSWVEEGKIKGIDEPVFKIAEDEKGNLWLGTLKHGIIKLNFYMGREMSALVAKKGIRRDIKIFRYNTEHGLPEGDFIVIMEKNGSPLFGTDKGIYRFDEKAERFFADTVIMKKINREGRGIHRFNRDQKGNLWMVNYVGSEFEVGFAKFLSDSDIIWNSTPFIDISKGVIHAFYHDDHGVSWLGGVDGLFQYDSNIEKDYTKTYNTLIRKVSIGEDSMIFKGTNFNDSGQVSLPQSPWFRNSLDYGNNSIAFEFAGQSYENEAATLYNRYLEGFDKNWSEWKPETKAVYTNLHEGTYTFRVKAKNLYKTISTEASYEFTILPPWYRTIWAYILYVLLFFGTLYAGIKMNSRRLIAKNQELEAIVAERTKEVVHQKEVIEHKNRDIMDSINYAQGIQQAILPPDEKFKNYLPDSFILFMPRDVVSGDFYWMEVVGNGNGSQAVLFSVCDCTGHGVPGGFVSMVGQNGLRRAVNEQGLVQPAQILDSVSLIVEEAFRKGKRKDGMDAILCSLEFGNRNKENASVSASSLLTKLQYSAANNPLYLVRKKENGPLYESADGALVPGKDLHLQQSLPDKPVEPDVETATHYLFHLDPDKQPVGAYDYRKPFSNHYFILRPGDTIYLSSDGFRDQFGGVKGKKYMAKNFKQLLASIQDQSMDEQKNFLQKNIRDWMGDNDQNDDICVIGVRV